MTSFLLHILLLFQPAQSVGSGGGGSSGGGGGGMGGPWMTIIMMAAGFLFLYLFVIRPEQKKRDETEEMQKTLKKGMKVRTDSGILGEIISMTEREVVLAVADKVRLNVLRSHILGPEVDADAAKKAEAAKKSAETASKDAGKKDAAKKAG